MALPIRNAKYCLNALQNTDDCLSLGEDFLIAKIAEACGDLTLEGLLELLNSRMFITASIFSAQSTRQILDDFVARQGNDLCHYNPEILEELLHLYGIEHKPFELPPECEFRQNCSHYADHLYQGIKYEPIQSPSSD